MKRLFFSLLCMLLFEAVQAQIPQMSGKVIKVIDGTTALAGDFHEAIESFPRCASERVLVPHYDAVSGTFLRWRRSQGLLLEPGQPGTITGDEGP